MLILKLKNTNKYYKNTIDGNCYNTWDKEFARVFKHKEDIKGQIKVELDIGRYEIINLD